MLSTASELIPQTVVDPRCQQGSRSRLVTRCSPIEFGYINNLPGGKRIHFQRLLVYCQITTGGRVHRQHPHIEFTDLIDEGNLHMQPRLNVRADLFTEAQQHPTLPLTDNVE